MVCDLNPCKWTYPQPVLESAHSTCAGGVPVPLSDGRLGRVPISESYQVERRGFLLAFDILIVVLAQKSVERRQKDRC